MLVYSFNPIISGLAHQAVNTVLSVTGRNVANIRQEFGANPLVCGPGSITIMKSDITNNDRDNLDLLASLLEQKMGEVDRDTINNFDILIDEICQQR